MGRKNVHTNDVTTKHNQTPTYNSVRLSEIMIQIQGSVPLSPGVPANTCTYITICDYTVSFLDSARLRRTCELWVSPNSYEERPSSAWVGTRKHSLYLPLTCSHYFLLSQILLQSCLLILIYYRWCWPRYWKTVTGLQNRKFDDKQQIMCESIYPTIYWQAYAERRRIFGELRYTDRISNRAAYWGNVKIV
jgi:hypothetical protein